MAKCRWVEGDQCNHPRLFEFSDRRIVVAEELQPPSPQEGGWRAGNIHLEGANYVADCGAVADFGEEEMDQADCWTEPYPPEIIEYKKEHTLSSA